MPTKLRLNSVLPAPPKKKQKVKSLINLLKEIELVVNLSTKAKKQITRLEPDFKAIVNKMTDF